MFFVVFLFFAINLSIIIDKTVFLCYNVTVKYN